MRCAIGCIVKARVRNTSPTTFEILTPFALGPYVAGGMRGSHQMPFMPVPLNSGISYFDGPPVVSCAAFSVHAGRLTEPVDVFAHPFWNDVRDRISAKAVDMRRQGFFGAAMLPMAELEYTGIMEKLAALEGRFTVR
jgi:fructose 1,6-bisphosphate aldolase/phosphatase